MEAERDVMHTGEGIVTMEAETGVMQSQANGGWLPTEAGEASNEFSPPSLSRKGSPADTLILVQWTDFRLLELQERKFLLL